MQSRLLEDNYSEYFHRPGSRIHCTEDKSTDSSHLDELYEDDEHDRVVTIELPVEAAQECGYQTIHVPIRNILELVAQLVPKDREWLTQVRDEFYSGDHDDDHNVRIDPPTSVPQSLSVFQIAQRRFDRLLARYWRMSRRNLKTQQSAAVGAKLDKNQEVLCDSFLAEFAALEAERLGRGERWKKLHVDALNAISMSVLMDESVGDAHLAEAERDIGAREWELELENDDWLRRWNELDRRANATRTEAVQRG